MKQIVTPRQMRLIEETAFENGIDQLDLMERAAECVADELEEMTGLHGKRAVFFCGKGNNGGDGLAAARIVAMRGGEPLIIMREDPATHAAGTNARRARELGIRIERELPEGLRFDAAVDALIGIGMSKRALPPGMRSDIESINALGCPVLAVDVPSGMDALTGDCADICVRADRTVSFGWAKTGHYLSSQAERAGDLIVRDIGLGAFAREMRLIETLEEEDLRACLPKREKTSHKGNNGRVLLYCGSLGMAGAAAMAALGCLRAGAGLVYIACEESVIPVLQVLVPNAQCVPIHRALERTPRHDVFLAGCGLGQSDEIYQNLLQLYDPAIPSVLDADALNLLSLRPFLLGEKTLITPHVGEAARLLNMDAGDVAGDMLAAAESLKSRYGAVVALKSHCTVIQQGDRVSFNTVGSQVLAKGGSGDALAGIIAGLMAQGLDGFEAAGTGSLWLGKAARLAHKRMGPHSPLTGDILALLGEASIM